MNIGSFVWNVFNGVLRFGTIVRMDLDVSGWAYCSVVWHDDEVYDRATGGLRRRYRVDELNLVPISHLAQSIIQHGVTFPMRHGDSEVPAC
jgi:hypothetical protein